MNDSSATKSMMTRVLPAPPHGAPGADDEILTAREAQQFLKIGRTKLWDLTRRNEIPAYRVGPGSRSSLRYKRNELLRWLEGNRVSGATL